MKNTISTMISSSDINDYLQSYTNTPINDKILEYKDLLQYNNINDLLPNKRDFVIILTQFKKDCGHFCAITRGPDSKGKDTITWFDSLGGKNGKPDAELHLIPDYTNEQFNQDSPVISNLIFTADKNQRLVYNNKKIQKNDPSVATCGRFCIAFIIAIMKYGLDYDDFVDFFKVMTKKYNCSNDELVCHIIP